MRDDHALKVFDRVRAEPDLRQRSELVERDRLAPPRAVQALHGALVGIGDAVEYLNNVARVGIGVLDGG